MRAASLLYKSSRLLYAACLFLSNKSFCRKADRRFFFRFPAHILCIG